MLIGFNARVLAASQVRGWTRYAVQLLRHLPEFGAKLLLFCDQPLREEHLALLPPGSFRVVQSPRMRYLAWEQAWLPAMCARERVNVLHSPSNYGLPGVRTCPGILTLHDAIDVAFEPSTQPLPFRERLVRASFWIARHSAHRVITVSAHAKADIVKHFSIPPERISVIHEASDLQALTLSPDDERFAFEALGIGGPFVLYAGGFDRRKNVDFLVDAFLGAALPGVTLVLVGGQPPPSLSKMIRERGAENAIRLTGFVPDATLAALYRRALLFVYPSLYEGFGLQLCEAMSAGCPTLASNVTSLPEVLGSGGEAFSPYDREGLSALLRRVVLNSDYRAELAARASRRASDFSWRRTAELTYEVYRSCL